MEVVKSSRFTTHHSVDRVCFRVQSDWRRKKFAVHTSDLKALLAQKRIKLFAHIGNAPSISAAATGLRNRYLRRKGPMNDIQALELDLESFKLSLGSAPPAEFTAEGGLRKRWAAAHQHELIGWVKPALTTEIEHAAGLVVQANPWEAERKRKRRAAVRNAAMMLLAWTAAAIFWSQTEWQRRLESSLLQQNAVELVSPPPPSMNRADSANCPGCGNLVPTPPGTLQPDCPQCGRNQ